MIGSCLFLNGDIEKINGGADIFDSITLYSNVDSRLFSSSSVTVLGIDGFLNLTVMS